jgi:hypothetical protein
MLTAIQQGSPPLVSLLTTPGYVYKLATFYFSKRRDKCCGEVAKSFRLLSRQTKRGTMSKHIWINCYNCGEVCEVEDFGENSHKQWCPACLAERAERYEKAVNKNA